MEWISQRLSADARSLQEITAILVDFLVPVSHARRRSKCLRSTVEPAGFWEWRPVLRSREFHEAKSTILAFLSAAKRVLSIINSRETSGNLTVTRIRSR